MKNLILLTLICFTFPAFADVYVLGQGGYLKLRQEKAMENNVTPTGTSMGGGIGFRDKFYEFEAVFLKSTAEDDVIHDDEKNKMVHEQTSLLFGLNFYLTEKFYARFGYGFNRVNQELKKPVSTASAAGAKDAYGLTENTVTDGPLFGAGFVLYNGNKGTLFTQFEYLSYSSIDAGAINLSVGFRFYFGK